MVPPLSFINIILDLVSAVTCLASKFYSSLYAQVQTVNRESYGADLWSSLLDISAGMDNMTHRRYPLHMVIQLVVHSGSAETISLHFAKENQGGDCKKTQVKVILLASPLFSR